jgi:hypothetical protein
MLAARVEQKKEMTKGEKKWRDASLTKKAPYKPDAGNRHVRFDERGWETGRWPKAPSYRAHARLYHLYRFLRDFGAPQHGEQCKQSIARLTALSRFLCMRAAGPLT